MGDYNGADDGIEIVMLDPVDTVNVDVQASADGQGTDILVNGDLVMVLENTSPLDVNVDNIQVYFPEQTAA